MNESRYYHTDAEYKPNEPWNQAEPDAVTKEVEYSCTMRRKACVETTDYVPGTWEKDEDGFLYRNGDDFSDTDWLGDYNMQYRTPEELIDLLKVIAVELSQGVIHIKETKFWKDVVADCEKWTVEDEYAEEV